jgi:hypothetical protein
MLTLRTCTRPVSSKLKSESGICHHGVCGVVIFAASK